MLRVAISNDAVHFGKRFAVTFQRTLRVPDDGTVYPLPPSLGTFPVNQVADFADRVPPEWRARGGAFIPMYQREALWLGFEGVLHKPVAVQIGIGGINAISGDPWTRQLSVDPQNYVVCPDQPWLDGINAGHGLIRQFVAMPLGRGYTVEEQLTGRAEFGGIQVRVYEAKPGRFPERRRRHTLDQQDAAPVMRMEHEPMGLAAGGQMRQRVYPDSYGIDSWNQQKFSNVFVHIVNSEQYRALTDQPPPPTPIGPQTYTEHGFPWFELYDEAQGEIAGSPKLAEVKTVRERDLENDPTGGQDDSTVQIDPKQIIGLKPLNVRKPR